MVKQIELTQGKVALVDDEDYPRVSQYRWQYAYSYGRGYATRAVRNKGGAQRREFMHKVLMPCRPGCIVDHVNGNSLDNRRCNLREATRSQNAANSRKRTSGSSRFKGVSWYKPRRQWRCALYDHGKLIDLGFFDDESEAGRAYDIEAKRVYGEFARLNFPEKIVPLM